MNEDIDIDINIEDLDVPKQPTLYDINQSFNVIKTKNYNGIVGEEQARMVIFTNFILGKKPVILKGSRASGKSNIMRIASVYSKSPVEVASSSEKAYQRMSQLNKHSHLIIPEVNKINEKTVEMLKDFGEGEAHQYSFTNAYKEVETIKIDAKPFMTSIADENRNVDALGEELLSRLTVVRTDSSVQQNINVIEEKLRRAENPFYKQDVSQEEVNEYIKYVHLLPDIDDFSFIYPAGEAVRKAIPPLFTDSRRDTDKYLANTYGITLFHYHDRIMKKFNGKKYLFVTPADIWYNHRIYQQILVESSLKCGAIEQEIIQVLKEKGNEERTDEWNNNVTGLKVGEIHTELLKRNYTPTVVSVMKMCNQLVETGYLTKNDEVRPNRFNINPELHREYHFEINWHTIVKACEDSVMKNFPDIADEYISRFCGDTILVTDPFTGEVVNILATEPPEEEVVDDKIKNIERENEALKKSLLETVDVKDKLQEDIIARMKEVDKPTVSFAELSDLGNESDIQDVLAYLIKVGQVYKPKPDQFGLLE